MRPTAGIGFKPEHLDAVLRSPAVGLWLEVHPENYMVDGGVRKRTLAAIAEAWPLSLHGVGLSLAGDMAPDPDHLARLKMLVDTYRPFIVSEHLAWSRSGTTFFPDLLPFPRTTQALHRIGDNIDRMQTTLGRTVLVENPSLYLHLNGHQWSETDFLAELVARSGCGLLVDVNNVHVSASNLGYDPRVYLDALPEDAIGEIHLAGHTPDNEHGDALLIDSHDAPVAEAVWALYRYLIDRIGETPTLIERDGNIPQFEDLMSERDRAAAILDTARSYNHV
ncbi:DUF692 domain-containing protein [Sphingomonas sp. TREG-RG-20F-R18-01]|uniref:MNIO family bufferin maturase n=1 Tax=Sphingomonas sp. TREG-RG-20F-R18-01 TaxID=2914982 RepID=UPI001F5A9816|nr:DUF692 domain-containing protein [Sphingomonas sp. TREG-RG-20F-R18-01]